MRYMMSQNAQGVGRTLLSAAVGFDFLERKH